MNKLKTIHNMKKYKKKMKKKMIVKANIQDII